MSGTAVMVLALAVGTYAFRLVGPVLHGRVELPDRVRVLLSAGAVVLLVALLATGALTEGGSSPGGRGPPGSPWAGCWRGAGRRSPWWCSARRRRRRCCGRPGCRSRPRC